MATDRLKFVLVPWGSTSSGDDVWLLENALLFGLETIFEQTVADSEVQFADITSQLGAELKKTSVVAPYLESDLNALASRTPVDVNGIIDGLLTVHREPATHKIISAEIAPRLFRLPERSFVIPDAFVFSAFSTDPGSDLSLQIANIETWNSLVIEVAESLLEPFGWSVPAHIGPETVRVSTSWAAHCAFLKAKRGASTVEEKLGYYRQATRNDPNFYWAHFNAGQLYKQQEDYHSARREFLASVNSAQDNPAQLGDLYFELGLCSIFLGDTKTARKFWDEALVHAPSNPTLLINIAGTYEQEEDWHRALELHKEALAIEPDNYKALVNLARLTAQIGDIEGAIPLYERALKLKPNDPLRHAILGGCYASLGDDDRARGYFETASDMDPPGSKQQIRIDEADAPPSPGDYARAEIAKLDEAAAKLAKKNSREERGWKWFNRS